MGTISLSEVAAVSEGRGVGNCLVSSPGKNLLC